MSEAARIRDGGSAAGNGTHVGWSSALAAASSADESVLDFVSRTMLAVPAHGARVTGQ